jgi:hypothetical protein
MELRMGDWGLRGSITFKEVAKEGLLSYLRCDGLPLLQDTTLRYGLLSILGRF